MHRIVLCLPVAVGFLGMMVMSAQADVVKDNGAPLPSQGQMEQLARTDPVAFLEACLRRYAREVKGYTLVFQKQETIGGTIQPTEIIEVRFRDRPHSVFFNWMEGGKLAEKVLYVEGENNGKMLVRPRGALARLVAGDVVSRDVDGPDAKNSGRYTIDQFGLKKGAERTYTSWKAAKDKGSLAVDFQGVKNVKELNNRPCWMLRRLAPAPENGVKETTIFVDTELWLQTGIVLKDADGLLLGSYWFKDIKLNPPFAADQFQPGALKQ